MTQTPVTPLPPSWLGAKQADRLSECSPVEPTDQGGEANPLFNLAFQASIAQADAYLPVTGWSDLAQTQGALTESAQFSGRILPFQAGSSGNGLPLSAQTPLRPFELACSQLCSPTLSSEVQGDFLPQSLLAGQTATANLSGLSRFENLLQVPDGMDIRPLSLGTGQGLPALPGEFSPRSGLAAFSLGVPVGKPGWGQELGERIHWMVGRSIQNAEVKLTPPHLGPLEIRISVQNDQASISFVAAQAPTREALEASIPRLREMLGEVNLNLAQVDVGGQESADYRRQEQAYGHRSSLPQGAVQPVGDQPDAVERPQVVRSIGLVDDYV